ncbi:hypothetical protein RF640_05065 [Kocuria sp. CPCC 205231]|uniref:hypothetical protein n=1 Tax=Kocuria sp. CPCC 205231 TaxID=3073551 RepID=UPI0034D51811
MSNSKISRNLIVVALFGLFLVTQLAMSSIVDPEPYPTIRMPGFGAAPDSNGMFDTKAVDISIHYEDGVTINPHVADVMRGFRYSSATHSFNYVFSESEISRVDKEVAEWLAARATDLRPHSSPSYVEICWYSFQLDISTVEEVDATPCELRRVNL